MMTDTALIDKGVDSHTGRYLPFSNQAAYNIFHTCPDKE